MALINAPAVGVPEVAYIQPDHLGPPRVVIDPARNVSIWEWSNKSEVFGNQVPNSDPDGDGVAFELALRFPGQQATEASGLNYNYQREYDPAVGRYSQSDPIGLRGGMTTYGYVDGDAVGATDPLGLQKAMPRLVPAPVGGGVRIDQDGYLVADSGYVGQYPNAPMTGFYPSNSVPGGATSALLSAIALSNAYLSKKLGTQGKPSREQKPANCPTGTVPINKWPGLSKDDVHGITSGVSAGPRDWVGISPDGHVWINEGGEGSDEGPLDVFLP